MTTFPSRAGLTGFLADFMLGFIKCTYSVSIKKAELDTTSGKTTFGVLIGMSLSDSDYHESVEVNLN